MEMCPKDVVDILVSRMDNRLLGTPIIELEFEKNTVDHIYKLEEKTFNYE